MAFYDHDVPEALGAELYRPKPQYFVKNVVRPKVVWDWTRGPNDTVQLDRFNWWADNDTNGSYESSLTKEARTRSHLQTIGVGSSRSLNKEKVILTLKEFTGPSDINNPNSPSTFQISVQDIITAQRKLYEYGTPAFHDSIGSSNLLDDFRRWEDRVYIEELLKTDFSLNPQGLADGATVNLTSTDYTFEGRPPKWSVYDSDYTVKELKKRNCPTFEDGNYICICSPDFFFHLERDSEFREIATNQSRLMIPVSQMIPPAEPTGIPQIPLRSDMAALWQGGQFAHQPTNVMGQDLMQGGIVFRGVRYFISNNMPTETINMNYTNPISGVTAGAADRTAELGIFFGPQCIGVGIGGAGPQVRLNNNDDFQRFVIAIWHIYGDWQLLDKRFVTVGRSFVT